MNESIGNELKVTLNQEYGADRTEFYTVDVTSEEQFKGADEIHSMYLPSMLKTE